jgi:hypothetical protein
MIGILIEYTNSNDNNITITMIRGGDPVMEIDIDIWYVVERKFSKTDSNYYKFSTYEIPGMKLCKYGWSRDQELVGPAVIREPEGLWNVALFGCGSERGINFNNFGPVWVEMLEDYHQMKIDVKRLNSQNQ